MITKTSLHSGTEAFRWTHFDGMTGLGDLSGGGFHSAAFGVSGDGLVILREGYSASGYQAFRWTQTGGITGLGYLSTTGALDGRAYGVSGDGTVVIGESSSTSGFEAFRWTESAGMVELGWFGQLPGGDLLGDPDSSSWLDSRSPPSELSRTISFRNAKTNIGANALSMRPVSYLYFTGNWKDEKGQAPRAGDLCNFRTKPIVEGIKHRCFDFGTIRKDAVDEPLKHVAICEQLYALFVPNRIVTSRLLSLKGCFAGNALGDNCGGGSAHIERLRDLAAGLGGRFAPELICDSMGQCLAAGEVGSVCGGASGAGVGW